MLFLVRVLRLGLLVHRGSGLPSPDPEGWHALMQRIVECFGDPHSEDHLVEAASGAEPGPGGGAGAAAFGPGGTRDRNEPEGHRPGSP